MRKIWFLFLCPVLAFCQKPLDDVEMLFENKQFEKAEIIIKEYLHSNPNSIEAIEFLGYAYGYQKKWNDAIDCYKKLVKFNPKNANYHYKYGGVLGMKALQNKLKAIGFIGDIESSFIKAAELDPNHIETRWALVELYMQLPGIFGGSKSKSLHYAQELENLSKVDGYLAKGYIYEYDNEPEKAEKYYKKAIIEGGSLTCFNKLAKLYEKEKAPEKAIEIIQEAQKIHKRNALHYQIGKVAAEYNIELQKGKRCLKTYLKNYSEVDGVPKAWANYRLAQIYTYQNNKAEALKCIDLALAELPEIKTFSKLKSKISNL